MLRQYDPENPETYMIDSQGDKVEMISLTLGDREKYLQEVTDATTNDGNIAVLCKFVKTINGQPAEEVLYRCTHLADMQLLYLDIVGASLIPEDVSKNSKPSPESSEQEKVEGATNRAGTDEDNVSITQPI